MPGFSCIRKKENNMGQVIKNILQGVKKANLIYKY